MFALAVRDATLVAELLSSTKDTNAESSRNSRVPCAPTRSSVKTALIGTFAICTTIIRATDGDNDDAEFFFCL